MSRLQMFLGLLGGLVLAACSEEKVMPAYREDLAELFTDAGGTAAFLRFDDGRERWVSSRLEGLVPDTLYRVQVLYVDEGRAAVLQGVRKVLSDFPLKGNGGEDFPSDPLSLKSAWLAPRYLNLQVSVKTGGGQQRFAFVERGVQEYPDGKKTLTLELCHEQMGDPLYYTKEVTLSCPLYGYAGSLSGGCDSVKLLLPDFGGRQERTFPY